MPSVSECMRAARIKQDMTIKRLSELSGITPGAICKIECGVNKPNLTTVEILADALGLSIDEYVGHVKVERKHKK